MSQVIAAWQLLKVGYAAYTTYTNAIGMARLMYYVGSLAYGILPTRTAAAPPHQDIPLGSLPIRRDDAPAVCVRAVQEQDAPAICVHAAQEQDAGARSTEPARSVHTAQIHDAAPPSEESEWQILR